MDFSFKKLTFLIGFIEVRQLWLRLIYSRSETHIWERDYIDEMLFLERCSYLSWENEMWEIEFKTELSFIDKLMVWTLHSIMYLQISKKERESSSFSSDYLLKLPIISFCFWRKLLSFVCIFSPYSFASERRTMDLFSFIKNYSINREKVVIILCYHRIDQKHK